MSDLTLRPFISYCVSIPVYLVLSRYLSRRTTINHITQKPWIGAILSDLRSSISYRVLLSSLAQYAVDSRRKETVSGPLIACPVGIFLFEKFDFTH